MDSTAFPRNRYTRPSPTAWGGRGEGTTASYYHQDALGSTRAVTDGSGAIVWATQYNPFGLEYGTSTSGDAKLRFPGQWRDAPTGLYYLFRRFYDPEVGRFLSQDRILGHLTVPQSLARYVYAMNPLTQTQRRRTRAVRFLACRLPGVSFRGLSVLP